MAKNIVRLIGAIITLSLAKGILAWLASHNIHPHLWIAEMLGVAESAALAEGIWWILLGVAGLIGLFLSPLLHSYSIRFWRWLRPASTPWITTYVGPTSPCYQSGRISIGFQLTGQNISELDIQKCRIEVHNNRTEALHNVFLRLERMEGYTNHCLPELLNPYKSNHEDGSVDINPRMSEYFDVAELIEDVNAKEKRLKLCYFNKELPNIIPEDKAYTLVIYISGHEFKKPIITRFILSVDEVRGLVLEQIHGDG